MTMSALKNWRRADTQGDCQRQQRKTFIPLRERADIRSSNSLKRAARIFLLSENREGRQRDPGGGNECLVNY
jgi:hypothetical protein